MRVILLLFGFLSCFFFEVSCKRDAPRSTQGQLIGNWELRSFQGGFLGPGGAPDVKPGNGNRWKFSDTLYQVYSHDLLTSSGSYKVIKMDTGDGYPADALILNNNTYSFARISIAKDTLTMFVGIIAADGYIAKYIRQ